MRELCAGIDVDLGTAAAFREQWSREVGFRASAGGKPMPLLLKTDQALGDALVMTAAIYSLHQAHPRRYLTAVESNYPEVFEYNPDVSMHLMPCQNEPHITHGMSDIQMHYPAIHKSNERGIHFMQGWCEFLGAALGIQVPLLTNRPRLYFDRPLPEELPIHLKGDYWLICSGGKSDFTNKLWGYHNYQEVVDLLHDKIRFIQVGHGDDNHPPLRVYNGANAVGKTSIRLIFELVRRARGVVCGVSFLMHVAAALEKPAVVIAGGREPVQWNGYPRQHYLHTVGALPCTTPQGAGGGACWRSRTVPIGDGSIMDRDTCQRPVVSTPECMTLIRPEQVAALVMMYESQYAKKEEDI